MVHSKFARITALLLLTLMVMTVVGGVAAQDTGNKVLHTAINMVGGDPETLDPNLAQDSQEISIINEMYVGLTRQNVTTGDVAPGIAKDWTVSDDGKTWTFNMIHDIPWVKYNADTGKVEEVKDDSGNVRYVTAQDIVYSWQRVLDPATASPYAYVPADFVVGGADVNAGKAAPDTLAVKAVDDYTFQVTGPDAVGFATNIYGLWMVNPVPQWAIESCGDSWTEPDCVESFGPFAMKDWQHDTSVTLVKNPFWPGVDAVPQSKLDEVDMAFLDPQTQFANYQAGTLDAINPPLEQLDFIKSDATLSKELSIGTSPCTYYLGFNVDKPVVSDVHLRRALSYAVDRQSIVDNVTKGGQIPARWFARPGLQAAPTPDTNPDLGITFDVDKAKSELALALKDLNVSSAADLPPITLAYNDSSGHAAIMAAIQQMWQTELGVQVQLSAREPSTYFSSLTADSPQIFRSGWCQDYPDADNFDRVVFRSDSVQNNGHFNSPDFDKLVDQARLETDVAKRRDLYAQAEQILNVDQAGIIPVYWYTTVQLTNPKIERTHSVVGREAYETWDINQ